jgi:hypothetical protein
MLELTKHATICLRQQQTHIQQGHQQSHDLIVINVIINPVTWQAASKPPLWATALLR